MSEVKWIKIVVDIFDDEKILLIEQLPDADSVIVIWFKLLCLAGKQNNSGVFMVGSLPCTDEMLAAIFRRPLNTVKLALSTFEKLGMIEVVNDCISIPKWGKYQSLEGLERSRELTRARVASYRERQKMLGCAGEEDVTLRNVTVTGTDKNRVDKNRVEKKKNEREPKRFTPPTLEEVKAYIQERGSNVDAEHWYAHYEANGWRVGRNPMKNWKQAVITWERNGIDKRAPEPKQNAALNYEQRTYDDDEFQSGDYMREAEEFMRKQKEEGL